MNVLMRRMCYDDVTYVLMLDNILNNCSFIDFILNTSLALSVGRLMQHFRQINASSVKLSRLHQHHNVHTYTLQNIHLFCPCLPVGHQAFPLLILFDAHWSSYVLLILSRLKFEDESILILLCVYLMCNNNDLHSLQYFHFLFYFHHCFYRLITLVNSSHYNVNRHPPTLY